MAMMARKVVLGWENLGPTHFDRLKACHDDPALDVRAVEFFAVSTVYDWDSSGFAGLRRETLFPSHAAASGPRLCWRLIKAIRRERPDAVFMCHYNEPAVFFASLILRLSGIPVFTMIDSKFDDKPRGQWRELFKGIMLLPYAGALVGSRRSAEYLRFLGVRGPIEEGFDCLDVQRLKGLLPDIEGKACHHSDRDFLVVARLIREKNLDLVLRAFALWRNRARHARKLRILGGGPLESTLRALAIELKIQDDVIFEGAAAPGRVAEAMRDALALLFPSVQETFGFVVIEAFAQGLPVLISPVPGAVDGLIDNGVNGWIVDPFRPDALVAAMELLDRDEQAWKRASAAALNSAERGDVRHFVQSVRRLAGAG